MPKFGSDDFGKKRCPMCGRSFISGAKLNRHKRTCPAKEDSE